MLQDKDLVSIQEVRSKVEKAYQAWLKFREFPQDRIDAIVERMAAAARSESRRLAELAVEETGYGNAPSKLVKNLLCCDLLPRRMRGMKTVGILRELPDEKMVEIGVPVGVIAAVLPTTNPTSTAIYKTLISLKAGNTIVVSPHPRAKRCTCETTAVLYRAALEAGAPEGVIECIDNASMEGTQALMNHPRVSVILATGGHGIVKAAYSTGKPAYGVGPGNVPALIERTADVVDAVAKVVEGKSFDYGTVCSSEQAIVAEEPLRAQVMAELKRNKAYFCTPEQKTALGKILLTPSWTVNPACVGQAPQKIAKMAGFEIPADASIIVVEDEGVGKEYPLSAEKLSPVLSLYFKPDFESCMDVCYSLLRFGGLGHTCVIHSRDDAKIRAYGLRMPAMRVLVNTPSPQGSTGVTTNVFPAMTLGCGAAAGNATSDNIGPQHLMNVKRIAYAVRTPQEAFEVSLDMNAAPPPPPGPAPDRSEIASAVERYLSVKGLTKSTSQEALVASIAADVVDRFLKAKAAQVEKPATAPDPPAAISGYG